MCMEEGGIRGQGASCKGRATFASETNYLLSEVGSSCIGASRSAEDDHVSQEFISGDFFHFQI